MNTAGNSILIVDDETDHCANMRDILADFGFRTDCAYDGLGALELVQQNRYDFALLDLRMPGMNGLELYRRIKSLRSDTQAILLTAFPPADSDVASGGEDLPRVLQKPVDIGELMALIA